MKQDSLEECEDASQHVCLYTLSDILGVEAAYQIVTPELYISSALTDLSTRAEVNQFSCRIEGDTY